MSDDVAERIEEQFEEILSFRRAISSESDRGCVLFAASYLDASLSKLLCESLVANKNVEKDLFEGTMPLATFSSRIKMAFYLGLISQKCRQNLDMIRSIRNDFAHRLEVDLFAVQSVGDRCRSLSYSYHGKDASPRSHYTAAVFCVLAKVHVATFKFSKHVEKVDEGPTEADKAAHRERMKTLMDNIQSDPVNDVTTQPPPAEAG